MMHNKSALFLSKDKIQWFRTSLSHKSKIALKRRFKLLSRLPTKPNQQITLNPNNNQTMFMLIQRSTPLLHLNLLKWEFKNS